MHYWQLVAETGVTHPGSKEKVTVERCVTCGTVKYGPWYDQAGGARPHYTFYAVGDPFGRDWPEPPCRLPG